MDIVVSYTMYVTLIFRISYLGYAYLGTYLPSFFKLSFTTKLRVRPHTLAEQVHSHSFCLQHQKAPGDIHLLPVLRLSIQADKGFLLCRVNSGSSSGSISDCCSLTKFLHLHLGCFQVKPRSSGLYIKPALHSSITTVDIAVSSPTAPPKCLGQRMHFLTEKESKQHS